MCSASTEHGQSIGDFQGAHVLRQHWRLANPPEAAVGLHPEHDQPRVDNCVDVAAVQRRAHKEAAHLAYWLWLGHCDHYSRVVRAIGISNRRVEGEMAERQAARAQPILLPIGRQPAACGRKARSAPRRSVMPSACPVVVFVNVDASNFELLDPAPKLRVLQRIA